MKTPEQVLTEWVNDAIIFDASPAWPVGNSVWSRRDFESVTGTVQGGEAGMVGDIHWKTIKEIAKARGEEIKLTPQWLAQFESFTELIVYFHDKGYRDDKVPEPFDYESVDRSYDPMTTISIKKLREMGLKIKPEIPDSAWVPLAAVVYSPLAPDPGRLFQKMGVRVDAETKWGRISAMTP